MKKIINVGLAGFGMSGKIFQAPFLDADERFLIKKVYERTSEKSKEEYPYVEIVRTYEELLTDDIDLVIISTPNSQHYPMAKQAIEAGKNIIVEKPIATTSVEAEELCKLAKDKQVLFSVYQNRRLDGDFLTIKKLINSGELSDVLDYSVHYDRYVVGKSTKQWKTAGDKGTNILYDLGVHIIDQAVSLFGMPNEVYADFRKQREESGGIDNFGVILYYNDKKVSLFAGELVLENELRYSVHARKGSYVKYGTDAQEKLLIAGLRPGIKGWGEEEKECWGTLFTIEDGVKTSKKIRTEIGNYGNYYDNIYHVLAGEGELLVKPEEAVSVLRIIEAAIESNNEKRRIEFVTVQPCRNDCTN
jgi:predicted dehydrogenase